MKLSKVPLLLMTLPEAREEILRLRDREIPRLEQKVARLQGEIEDYLNFLDGKYTHVPEAKAIEVLRAAIEGKEAEGRGPEAP